MKKVWVYDIECYSYIFLLVFIDINSDETRVFKVYKEIDERERLKTFLKDEVSGLVSYNGLHYDSQLIEYIYRNPNFTVQELRNYSDIIVNSENRFPDIPEWKLRIPHLDLYRIHHYDNKNRRTSLKWLEFSMDMENIEDLPSDGDGDNWIEQVEAYCINDVLSTKELYNRSTKEINLRKALSKMYNLNFRNASNSKIGSELCLKLYCNATGKFKSDVKSLRTYRKSVDCKDVIFDYIKFTSKEFNMVLDRFKSTIVENMKGDIEFSQVYKGFQFDYGAGGIHGSVTNNIVQSDNDWEIIDCDVSSLYPSIAIKNKLYPEHLGEDFCKVYEHDIVGVRLAEKAKKENGNKAIIEGFKEAANSVYGKSNSEFSWLFDMKYTLATTVNGQLLLTMLSEKLMDIPNLQLIQINTDGITVYIHKDSIEQYYNVCKEWELLTNLQLEYANYKLMVIRDVNNYLSVYDNGKYKCKGAFEFENVPLHKNKSHSIIPKAAYEYFVNNIPIEDTIKNHRNIFDFCAGVRARATEKKGKSRFELHSVDGYNIKKEKLSKTVRYYISKKGKYLFKCYEDGSQEHVEAPLKQGKFTKDWKVKCFNKSWKCDNFEDYGIDYSYYIFHAKQWVYSIENKSQLKLF